MSRHSFDQRTGGCLDIGWDPPLNTFFLQIDAHLEEPTIWEGGVYGEHLEPERLVRYARRHSDEVPIDLAAVLRADQAAEPAWAPIEERIASGELKITLMLAGSPEMEPVELSPEAALEWHRDELERRRVNPNKGPPAAGEADPVGWAASMAEKRPRRAASLGLELHGGRANPIATTTTVSGSREGGVSSTTTTTFELDGCVVEFAGLAPIRSGDQVIVAGQRQATGVLRAYAVRLPEQGVLLGGSSLGDLLGAAAVLLIGCGVLLLGIPAFYLGTSAGDWPMPGLIPVALFMIIGVAMAVGGAAGMWSSTVADEAGKLVMEADAP